MAWIRRRMREREDSGRRNKFLVIMCHLTGCMYFPHDYTFFSLMVLLKIKFLVLFKNFHLPALVLCTATKLYDLLKYFDFLL